MSNSWKGHKIIDCKQYDYIFRKINIIIRKFNEVARYITHLYFKIQQHSYALAISN